MFRPNYTALAQASLGATVAVGSLAMAGSDEASTTTLAGAKATPVVTVHNPTAEVARAEMQTGLRVIRYDKARGKKNGYRLVARNGKKMIVKKGKNPVPYEVRGRCGSSWFMFTTPSRTHARSFTFRTGYNVVRPVAVYHWEWRIDGPGSVGWRNGLGSRARTEFLGRHAIVRHGRYAGLVTNAWVILDDGRVCGSSHPTDVRNF